MEISASILNMDTSRDIETFIELEKSGIEYFHIDVMDGKFVKNNTYNKMIDYCMKIKRVSVLPLDVHLMVEDVNKAIEDFLAVEPNIITIHLEACKDEEEVFCLINKIKENNCKVGIAIKPKTNIKDIIKFLPYVHLCLIMTVEPGKGGQELVQPTINKINELSVYLKKEKIDIDIEVDGGINLATAPIVKKAGANVLVSGSAILMAKNYKIIVDELKSK